MADIISPKGFLFSVAEAAIKKPGRPDMALIYSQKQAVAVATFTTNKVKGAPVKLCMQRIKQGKAQAIVINSGNSNVSTGRRGVGDAEEMARLTARHLHISEESAYVCSTGVIGVVLPMEKIRPKIAEMTGTLGSAAPLDVAKAIMTTDTFPKAGVRQIKIGRGTGTILGICKGAGMIAPSMATMLAFFMTDIAIKKTALKKAFREAVECSFNRITVDGDMSTSDTAIAMANGMLGNKEITEGSSYYGLFKRAVSGLAYELSKAIVRDGEGATKLIEVEVRGAKTEADALKGAFSVANSNLVKTAIYGADPNWGRVMAAIGHSGIYMKEEKTDIYFRGGPGALSKDPLKVVNKGLSTGKEDEAKDVLKEKEVKIIICLNAGASKANVLTCDLTEDYIRVNAHYRT